MPPEILFVTKPIAPPWNDGTKNLVRDLAEALARDGRVRPLVCGRAGLAPVVRGARTLPVFPAIGSRHALGPLDAARLLRTLVLGSPPSIAHFVAAPTVRAARVARVVVRLRGLRTVQTLASAPADDAALAGGLFGERLITLSRSMEARVRAAAPPGARVVRVPPPLALAARPDPAVVREIRARVGTDGARVVVFAGDLGPARGSELCVRAAALSPGTRLVVCARPKGARAAEHLAALEALARELGVGERVTFVGETPLVHAYLAAADVVVLPATDLTAKIDLPLVLLEAMLLERPVVVARGTPAAELAEAGAAAACDAVPEALAATLAALLGDPAGRAALAERGRAHVASEHDPDRVARAHVAIYEELLS